MKQFKRVVIIGDPHGDEVNTSATSSLFDFLDDFKPHIVVHGGDNWNFPQLRKGASDKDKRLDITADWQCGAEFFLKFMSYGKERYFLRGNHDERIWDLAREAEGPLQDYAQRCIRDIEKLVRARNATMLPYDARAGVLELGGLRIIHGYGHGVSAARQFAATYGTCVFLHTHSMEVGVFETWPEPAVAYGAGCLLNIDQEYNARQRAKLRHENGWAYGYLTNGAPIVMQARRSSATGSFYAAKEVSQY